MVFLMVKIDAQAHRHNLANNGCNRRARYAHGRQAEPSKNKK